jgi:hypothetical protein
MSYGEDGFGEGYFGDGDEDEDVTPEPEVEETPAPIDPITSGPWVRRG